LRIDGPRLMMWLMTARRDPLSVRFIEISGAIGALLGWRVAAGQPAPRIVCPHTGTTQAQIGGCFNRSVQATIVHWGEPMLLGVVLAAAMAIGLLLAARWIVHSAIPRPARRRR
jgi:hypothetical protein